LKGNYKRFDQRNEELLKDLSMQPQFLKLIAVQFFLLAVNCLPKDLNEICFHAVS